MGKDEGSEKRGRRPSCVYLDAQVQDLAQHRLNADFQDNALAKPKSHHNFESD